MDLPDSPNDAMNMANDHLTFSQKMQILWETKKMTVIAAIVALILIIVAIILLIVFLVVRPFDNHEEPHAESHPHSHPHSVRAAHEALQMASLGVHHLRNMS